MDPQHKLRLQESWAGLLETVSNVTAVVDELFTEGLITRSMKERIMQGNTTDSDRLRALMDLLPKRGGEAFEKFYNALIKCGEYDAADLLKPELKGQHKVASISKVVGVQEVTGVLPLATDIEDELPEKWPDPNIHNPSRTKLVKVSSTDTHMHSLFDQAVAGSSAIFCMRRQKRGIFLLIDNCKFNDARNAGVKLADRDGTEFDRMALDQLFQQLNFETVIKRDCTAQEIMNELQEIAGRDHLVFDCFVCAILTHGERDNVYGVDGKQILLTDITGAVDAQKCPTLTDKPKIFLIQACQGKRVDKGGGTLEQPGPVGDTQSVDDMNVVIRRVMDIHVRDGEQCDAVSERRTGTKSDIFLAVATVPDFVSWRNTKHGTWFIQAIVFILANFCHKHDLNRLMTMVNRLVSRAETQDEGNKQVSVFQSTFTKTFYFFPGLEKECISQAVMSAGGSETSYFGQSAQPSSHLQQPQQVEDKSPSKMI